MLIDSMAEKFGEGDDDWEGITCLHARLAKDILIKRPMMFVPNDNNNLSLPPFYFNEKVLKDGEETSKKRVHKLPSKTNVHRFSVVDDVCNPSLITVFLAKKTKTRIITCHDSYCRSKFSRQRSVKKYLEAEDLCSHLSTLKLNYDVGTLTFDSEDDDDDDDESIESTFNGIAINEEEEGEEEVENDQTVSVFLLCPNQIKR